MLLVSNGLYDNFDIARSSHQSVAIRRASWMTTLTVFNCRFDKGEELSVIEKDEWLKYRLRLFKKLIYPSLISLDVDDRILIMESPRSQTEQEAINELKCLMNLNIAIVKGLDEAVNIREAICKQIIEVVNKKVPSRSIYSIQIRVDSDDIILPEYVLSLAGHIATRYHSDSCGEFLVDPICGIEAEVTPGNKRRIGYKLWGENAFQSLVRIRRLDGFTNACIYDASHDQIHKLYKQEKLITAKPLWIQHLHGINVQNLFQGSMPADELLWRHLYPG